MTHLVTTTIIRGANQLAISGGVKMDSGVIGVIDEGEY